MSTELIINASLPETRIALMENGEIQELLIERPSGKGIVGNIYKGRVTRVLPGMQAAFVDIGLEKAAFLYVDDIYVHSEIWEEEEGEEKNPMKEIVTAGGESEGVITPLAEGQEAAAPVEAAADPAQVNAEAEASRHLAGDEEDFDEDDDDQGPVEMSGNPDDPNDVPSGTVSENAGSEAPANDASAEGQEAASSDAAGEKDASRRRHRRGRRGGKFRKRDREEGKDGKVVTSATVEIKPVGDYPENYHEQLSDEGMVDSDRSALGEAGATEGEITNRPEGVVVGNRPEGGAAPEGRADNRKEFRAQRGRDRRVRPKTSMRPPRAQVSIQDLLKEGQEVLVQVAKDPIATKGARLTCHISLPGRHLVCMPTIDHVGVSRRIERDDERRRLREYVEKNRPKGLGFIVRTASGKAQSEQIIKQDVDYLARLWGEIKEKAAVVTAPALVYEDLNPVLRAIRDWVTEEIDKIIVDSRYYFNDIQRFVAHFMPSLRSKVELYHGDIPVFDAYNISTELSRGLERKVWLKSGGYLVIDQAEALVAIDVNTGRYVGKKNLEDTILKTNLEAVQEIAYQLRLRNCGGIIILDLIDMEKDENKQRVYRALEESLKKDRARPSILKISELGLVEMTRKRTRDTMVRALCESCSHCEGKGFIKSKLTVAYEVLREVEREGVDRDVQKILVQANPDVIDILAIDERESLDQMERRYHKQIYLQSVGDMHPEQFEVSSDRKDRPAKEYVPESQRDRGRDRGRGRSSGSGRNRSNPGAGSGGGGERQERQERSAGPIRIPKPMRPMEPGLPGSSDAVITPTPSLIIVNPPHPVPSGDEQSFTPPTMIEPGNSVGPIPRVPGDDFYDEEDRLAFLRAQAAQDAALARLNAGAAGNATSTNPRQPRFGGGGAGRTNNNNDRSAGGRGGKGRGRRNGRTAGGPGRFVGRDPQMAGGPPPKIIPRGEGAAPVSQPVSSGSDDGGSSKGDGGNSQPPA